MSYNPKSYGIFGTEYYTIDNQNYILFTEFGVDYKKPRSVNVVDTKLGIYNLCNYFYDTILEDDDNSIRVSNMCNYLKDNKVLSVNNINNDYMMTVKYKLYNSQGSVVIDGSMSNRISECHMMYIPCGITESSVLTFKPVFVFDGYVEITIPRVSKYGILNQDKQQFILKIEYVKLTSTVGDIKYPFEQGSQVQNNNNHIPMVMMNHNPVAYHMHNSSHLMTSMTNNTSFMDQMVVPVQIDEPREYDEIVLSNIECDDSTYKINDKINNIVCQMEILVDNFNQTYDESVVNDILAENANPSVKDPE